MRLEVLTIFPDYLAPLSLSLVGKAIASGLVGLGVHDLRDWTVPDVLVSGHHARISAWRREQAERLTSERNPPVA
jgi:tRNA G37 N-methylase TrmD